MKRIGIYPGTFDPVHQGHIAFAQEAMRACQLSEVVFLPERCPRGKHHITDISHRVALLAQAIAAFPAFRIMNLASAQFTVRHTLPELQTACGGAPLTFLFGSDAVQAFRHGWEDVEVFLGQVSLAIGLRAPSKPHEIDALMAEFARKYDLPIAYTCVRAPHAGLASSQIRSNAASMHQLHPATASYIKLHKLYGS